MLGWGAVGSSVRENKTVENMERIFQAAKKNGFEVFISPTIFSRRARAENSTGTSKRMKPVPTCSLAPGC